MIGPIRPKKTRRATRSGSSAKVYSPDSSGKKRRPCPGPRAYSHVQAKERSPDPGAQGPPGGRTASPAAGPATPRAAAEAAAAPVCGKSGGSIGYAVPRSKGGEQRPPVEIDYEKSLYPGPQRIPFSPRADITLAAVPPPSGRGGRRGRKGRWDPTAPGGGIAGRRRPHPAHGRRPRSITRIYKSTDSPSSE